jgi:hypothetical protein
MKVEPKQQRYLDCPHCGGSKFVVEHLFDDLNDKSFKGKREAGPWGCKSCGGYFNLTVFADGTLDITLETQKSVPITVLLEIPPQKESIFLKVASETYGRPVTDDHNRYFYEEHTCPINWTRCVTEIKIGDDDDPHGLAKYCTWFVAEDPQRARSLLEHSTTPVTHRLPEAVPDKP